MTEKITYSNAAKHFLLLVFICVSVTVISQVPEPKPPVTRILFIFDGSFSMMGKWESSSKINIARTLLMNMVDSLQYIENVEMALRVYGHQSHVPPQDCDDTRLEVPFAKNNSSKIKQKLRSISPKGTTPIARSLELGGGDFPECENCRNIIILITDGDEECDGDPCAVSLALQKRGIVLKPFVIGIGLDMEFKKTFECVGHYFDATSEDMFETALGVIISQVLNSTTAQVNLLDSDNNPTETNVNMTFYDKLSGKIKYNYVHTINNRGNPDTVVLDPLVQYRMIAHTIPPVYIDSIKLTAGKHTVVATDAPQGYLIIKMQGSQFNYINAIIRKTGKLPTLNVQPVNKMEKYITGKYDLEVLTLPRTYIEDVEVSQSHTTTIEIPKPGKVTLLMRSPGYASIYVEKKNDLEWVYNIPEDVTNVTLNLQPGRYRAVYRARNAKESIYTSEKSFKVDSGGSVVVNLN